MAWQDYVDTVEKIYIAYYQRPADPLGLIYWAQRLDLAGGDLTEIIDAFANSEEAQALYGDITEDTIGTVIDAIYQAAFNRAPDEEGKNYYINGFKEGKFTPGTIALDILNGAKNDDAIILQNKLESALNFTKAIDPELDGKNLLATYEGNDDAQAGRDFLKDVGVTVDTVKDSSDAVKFIQEKIADPGDAIEQQTSGQTFTLTPGTDYADTTSSFKNNGLIASDFKFTSGNEKVTASAGTLNALDVLVDGSTTDADVLNATLINVVTPTAIQNIETINLTATVANSGLVFTNISGAKTVTLTGAANASLTNLNATAAPTIELNNYTKTATISAATLAGTSDALTLKVSGATASSTVIPGVTLAATTAGALETLNLESAGSSKNTIALALGTNVTALNKTVVTGAADLDLRLAHNLINGQTLDASGHTGALNLIVDRDSAATATTNLTNVSGVDTYTFRDSTAGGDALVATGLADGANVVLTYSTTGASSLAVKGAATNSNNVLNLTLDHATDATDVAVATSLTINDVETINIMSEGGTSTGNSITALTVSSGAKVSVDGSTKLDLQLAATSTVSAVEVKGSGNHKVDFAGAVTYGEGKNLTIDGSAATGKLTLDGSDFTGTGIPGGVVETLTIMGGSGDDTITGTDNANAKNVIDAGAGADVVNVKTANNSNVTLGAGADELKINGVTGAGSVTITDFALGSGGDKLSVDTSAAMTFGGLVTSATTGADGVAGTLSILGFAVADDAGAKAELATGGETAIIVINNATGVAELWYDADGNAGGEVKLATFENITTVGVLTDATSGFTAANFGTWA